ncbi:MAG TPA: DPP IV N-terminal domain-containing protein [Actinomycetota bacterium]
MSDSKQLLERARDSALGAVPAQDDFGRFVQYRDRRRRNQRLAAGAVAIALVLVVMGTALAVIRTPDSTTPGTSGGGGVVLPPDGEGGCFPEDSCWDLDMYIVHPDGSGLTRIGYGSERDLPTSWSPDGERIAFAEGLPVPESVEEDTRTAFTAEIYTIAVDGTDAFRLTHDPATDLFPVYSPDGTKIVFQSDRAGTFDIWVMDVDGSNPVRITEFENGTADEYAPIWSPDGQQIAFIRGKYTNGGAGKLWVIAADGSNGHLLLDEPLVSFPAWSPDGTRIAFEVGDWPEVSVQVLELETEAISDLGEGFHPIWSPDSTQLAISIQDGGFATVPLEDPGNRTTVYPSTFFAGAWSPDGQWIVFSDSPPSA